MKKFRIKSSAVWAVIIAACVIVGALLGFIAYGDRIWSSANQMMSQKSEIYEAKIAELEDAKEKLEAENGSLHLEIEGLNNKVTILSDTITQMKEIETSLTEKIEKSVTPTLLPITGSATIQEVTEAEPMNIFTTSEGAVVVSTAIGTVTEISEDEEFGHKVVIDHGNGYMSVYRNKGTPVVSVGDTVAQGGLLFVVSKNNKELGYQIIRDGVYINPSELMEIKG